MSLHVSDTAAFVGLENVDIVSKCRARFEQFQITEHLMARSVGARWLDRGTLVHIDMMYDGYFAQRQAAIAKLVFYLRALVIAGPTESERQAARVALGAVL